MKKKLIVASIGIFFPAILVAQTPSETSTVLERLNQLEERVARLESFHELREFTISADTLSTNSFSDQLRTLKLSEGDWLYVKAVGDMRGDGTINTAELCTTDSRLTSLLDKYLVRDWNPMTNNWFATQTNNELTYVRRDMDPQTAEWGVATDIFGDVYDFERLKLGGSGPHGGYLTVDINTNVPLIHFNIGSPDHKVTFRAGSTRKESCGF